MNLASSTLPVASAAGPWIATGALGTFLTLLFMLLKPAFAQWLPWLKLRSENAAALRKEKRDDLSTCQDQIKELRSELEDVRNRFHELELKLNGAITGYRILEAEVAATNPNAIALAHARAALSAAFTISSHELPPKE